MRERYVPSDTQLHGDPIPLGSFPETAYVVAGLNPEAQGLWEKFLESPIFQHGIKVLGARLKGGRRNTKGQESRFSGFVFEWLSYFFYRRDLSSDELVLSPWETRDLFAYMFPKHRLRSHNGLNGGIMGVRTPDGFF